MKCFIADPRASFRKMRRSRSDCSGAAPSGIRTLFRLSLRCKWAIRAQSATSLVMVIQQMQYTSFSRMRAQNLLGNRIEARLLEPDAESLAQLRFYLSTLVSSTVAIGTGMTFWYRMLEVMRRVNRSILPVEILSPPCSGVSKSVAVRMLMCGGLIE